MSEGSDLLADLGARANAPDVGPNATVLMNTFLFLQIIPSHFGLPLLVTTFLFSKGAKRHITLINVCITWILSGVFSTMLLYAGENTGPEPDKVLCRAQSSLLYGTTPMCSVAIFMLVYYVWTFYDSHRHKSSTFTMYTMNTAPYLTLAGWSLAAGLLATQNPEKVNRNRRFFYCSMDNSLFSNTMSIFVAVVCLATIAMEIRIAIMLYRNLRGLRKAGESGVISVQFVVRLLVFGIYIFMSMLFSLATMWNHSIIPDMYAATIGIAVMLVFGSQADIWRTWCFWRTQKPQQVINIPRKPSYDFDLDEKIDSDDDVLDISKPIPVHIKKEASYSGV